MRTPPSDEAAAFRRAHAAGEAFLPSSEHAARRALRRANASCRPKAPRITALLDRQGWLCALCHEPITRTSAVGFPDIFECATVDHIIPVSRGGTNAMDNLQAAHWKCNNDRGNKRLRLAVASGVA